MASNDSGSGIGILVIIGICVAGYYFCDFSLGSDQIADYTLMCQGDASSGQCSTAWVRGERSVYTVNRDQQVVVRQIDGEPPDRLVNCAVVDVKNWKCTAPGNKDTTLGFTDGKYWLENVALFGGVFTSPYERHVSKSDWFAGQEPPQKRSP